MPPSFRLAISVAFLLSSSALAPAGQDKKDPVHSKAGSVIVKKVDADKGAFTVQYTDSAGKSREKTFQLTEDIRFLDESGRLANIAVFQAGDEILLVENEGKLREVRRAPHRDQARRVSDTVRTLIELADGDGVCTDDLQTIYDMLRKLDTGKNGKLDPSAIKAEADQIVMERVTNTFSRLDANKDGKISRDEARGLIKEHFDKLDTNKDGFVEFDELLKAAKERHESTAGAAQSTSQKQK